MSKHTPGPWEAYSDGHVIDIRPAGKRESATVTRLYPSTPLAERWENARLIAAAPDLLEALAMLVSALDNDWNISPVVEVAKEAIAKAEGLS